jgi:glycine cleavage system pyridoxal-binding protein P
MVAVLKRAMDDVKRIYATKKHQEQARRWFLSKSNSIGIVQGVSLANLFSDIPKEIALKGLPLQQGRSQQDVETQLRLLAQQNKSFCELVSFIGGGFKPHYIPAAVKAIVSRSEFYTAYTPYQPETSQGFLQAIFEYQSMIAELTGMDVLDTGPFYHGTKADLQVGDLLTAGFSNITDRDILWRAQPLV